MQVTLTPAMLEALAKRRQLAAFIERCAQRHRAEPTLDGRERIIDEITDADRERVHLALFIAADLDTIATGIGDPRA